MNGPGTTPLTVVTIPLNPGYFVSGGNSIGTANASWITTNANGIGDTLSGLYTYSEAITTAGFAGGSFTYSGNWATDNCGSILLNNSLIAGVGTTIGGGANAGCNGSIVANFQTLTPFSFSVLLAAGVNNLQFQVYNAGVGPTGLLVDAGPSSTGGVPEPSSVLLTADGRVLAGLWDSPPSGSEVIAVQLCRCEPIWKLENWTLARRCTRWFESRSLSKDAWLQAFSFYLAADQRRACPW